MISQQRKRILVVVAEAIVEGDDHRMTRQLRAAVHGRDHVTEGDDVVMFLEIAQLPIELLARRADQFDVERPALLRARVEHAVIGQHEQLRLAQVRECAPWPCHP